MGIFMFVCTMVLYEYMNSPRNDVCNLFLNMHVRIKIHHEIYHCIIYRANEGVMLELYINIWYIRIREHALGIGSEVPGIINSVTGSYPLVHSLICLWWCDLQVHYNSVKGVFYLHIDERRKKHKSILINKIKNAEM
jgi:hypothetical protein